VDVSFCGVWSLISSDISTTQRYVVSNFKGSITVGGETLLQCKMSLELYSGLLLHTVGREKNCSLQFNSEASVAEAERDMRSWFRSCETVIAKGGR
jgi:hypothetical protein